MSSTFFDVEASEASRRPGEPDAGRAYMRTRSTSARLAATSESRPPSTTTSTASSGRAARLSKAKVEGYAGATEVEAPPARAHGADGPRGVPPPRGTGAPVAPMQGPQHAVADHVLGPLALANAGEGGGGEPEVERGALERPLVLRRGQHQDPQVLLHEHDRDPGDLERENLEAVHERVGGQPHNAGGTG